MKKQWSSRGEQGGRKSFGGSRSPRNKTSDRSFGRSDKGSERSERPERSGSKPFGERGGFSSAPRSGASRSSWGQKSFSSERSGEGRSDRPRRSFGSAPRGDRSFGGAPRASSWGSKPFGRGERGGFNRGDKGTFSPRGGSSFKPREERGGEEKPRLPWESRVERPRGNFSRAPQGGGFGGPRRSGFSSGGRSFGGRKPFGGSSSRFGGRGGFGGKKRGGGIDISLFISKAKAEAPKKEYVTKHTFDDFKFNERVRGNLKRKGYVTPTPIQDSAIPFALDGKDVLGLANTGTGKTAAFLLPLLEKMISNKDERALIVAPTRELALQIDNELKAFAHGTGIYGAVCVGGMPIFRQIHSLKQRPHFVIGTPGRLRDLRDRRLIDFGQFSNVVLDEVDHMLDIGFIDVVTEMLEALPEKRQALFFSATMPPRIRELVQKFQKEPVLVEVSTGKTAANVEQDVIRVHDKHMKIVELEKLLLSPELEKVLVFTETKRDVERLALDLEKKGFQVGYIHGDKRQRERNRAITDFKDGKTRVLVATDVAARGIDIQNITHVINYTAPQTLDDYTHRIGRTGRGDKKGKAITFID